MTQRNVFNRGLGANCRQGLGHADDLGAFIFLRPITLSSYIYNSFHTCSWTPSLYRRRMAVAGKASGLCLRLSKDVLRYSSRPIGRRRCFASVATPTGEGPLAGLRVLDMTRVLAGVRPIMADVTSVPG